MNKQHKLSIIVFSKDRPLQLHAYLESLLHFSDVQPGNISVLYKNSTGISYTKCIQKFKDVNWIEEASFFEDTLNLIKKAEDFIMFGVDDVVFKAKVDSQTVIDILKQNNHLLGFSLRLGRNIKPLPKSLREMKSYLEWNWKSSNEDHWNYPWELIATVYRKVDILDIVSRFNPTIVKNPNFFEGEVATDKEKYIRKASLGCFSTSKCVVITVNRVQDDFLNGYDSTFETDIETLYNIYQEGGEIDVMAISRKRNSDVHVGAEYFLLKGKKYPFSFHLKNMRLKFLNSLKKWYRLQR